MVQHALGTDNTGPVEEGPQARLRSRYANGIEVRLSFPDQRPHEGPRLGAVFVGEECKIEINRSNRQNADVEIGHRTATIRHLVNITRELGWRLRWDAAL